MIMSILRERARTLRVFQDNLQNDVPRVTTAVDHFLEQFVKVAKENDVLRVVVALVKIAQ
jgi:hypothetical protein